MADDEIRLEEGDPSEIAYGALEYDSNYNDNRPYKSPYNSGDDGWTSHTTKEEITTITPRALLS